MGARIAIQATKRDGSRKAAKRVLPISKGTSRHVTLPRTVIPNKCEDLRKISPGGRNDNALFHLLWQEKESWK